MQYHTSLSVQASSGCVEGSAHPEVLLLQVVHHSVDACSEHGSVVLVVGIGLVNGTLGFAAHTLHVLLVLLLNVLHPDVVDAVKQRNLHAHQNQPLKMQPWVLQVDGSV